MELIKASEDDQKQSWKVFNKALSPGHKTTVSPDTRIKHSASNDFNNAGLTTILSPEVKFSLTKLANKRVPLSDILNY